MKKRNLLITVLLIFTLLIPVHIADALSKIGSTGQEVRNIQTRLKAWGYYNGGIDGIYGWRTANAVKQFQRKHGITADGIAGPATLEKIGLPTGSSCQAHTNQTLHFSRES